MHISHIFTKPKTLVKHSNKHLLFIPIIQKQKQENKQLNFHTKMPLFHTQINPQTYEYCTRITSFVNSECKEDTC